MVADNKERCKLGLFNLEALVMGVLLASWSVHLFLTEIFQLSNELT